MARRAKFAPARAITAARRVQSALDDQAAALRGHLEVLRASCTPESVHDVRVACRRLRAALWLMRPVAPQARDTGERLRRLARSLAPLRETDVLIVRLQAGKTPALAAVASRLAERRDELVVAAQAVASRDALQGLPWHQTLDHPRLGQVLPVRLARLRRRFRHALRLTAQRLTPAHVHALRLRAKKLRYAIECASGAGRKTPATMNALRNLQEQLGACLDARLAANRLKALGQPTPAVRELARQLDTEARRAWRALPGVLHRFERNGWPRLKAAVPKPKGPKT